MIAVSVLSYRAVTSQGDHIMSCVRRNLENPVRCSFNPSLQERTIQELRGWMPELTMKADLTLKLMCYTGPNRLPLRLRTEEDATATVVRAMNRLNRYVLKQERRNRRLGAVAFLERGPMTNRPHLHMLLERPETVLVDDFATALQKAWTDQPFGNRQMRIEPVESLDRALHYAAKGGNIVYFHKHKPNNGDATNADDTTERNDANTEHQRDCRCCAADAP